MAVQVTNYQCPACGGPLQFEAGTGKLGCEYCGSSFPVAEIEALYAQKESEAAQNMAQEEARREQGGGESWDMSGMSDDWGADAAGMRVYICPSCGAELICDATTAATSCPYCANPTVVPGQFSGVLKPDYVIPFKLKKEEAIAALKKHYEGKPLLPKSFRDDNHLEEIKGVYVPFWLFDGQAEGSIAYEGTQSRRFRSGDYEITETKHFDVYRQGTVAFQRIPVDGSSKMPDDYMDSIEPFDYSEIKPFSTAYLPGYLADKYDVDVEACGKRADLRAENTAQDCLRETVQGYETLRESSKQLRLHRGQVKYALLPVWLLSTRWQDQVYLFAMNGQTGKFVGNLPVDKSIRRRIFAKVSAISALVLTLVALGLNFL